MSEDLKPQKAISTTEGAIDRMLNNPNANSDASLIAYRMHQLIGQFGQEFNPLTALDSLIKTAQGLRDDISKSLGNQ